MFRTELTIAPQERQLSRAARVLTVGSCFADSIGERLRVNKVHALVNPFGTVFQPLALAKLLRAAAGEEQDWQQHVVEARGRWQSYDFHATIGAESPVELLQNIQEAVRRVADFVRTADALVLTLGTAWAYRLRETDELVGNLHKLPASLFTKELLTADEIVNGLAEVHALVRRINPTIHIALTVSPVRHLKDTLPLNAVSKSVLRVACHYLSELLPDVSYFPAYELLLDDLRDYRFYASDMLHPSETAQDYIWERFARAYFDADFGRFRKEWAAVRQALGHRPLHPGAPEHRLFLDQTHERLERLASQGVEVRQELRDVQRQLAALPPPKPVRALEPEPEDDEERIDIGEPASAERPVGPAASEPVASQLPRRDAQQRNQRLDYRQPDTASAVTPLVSSPVELVETTAKMVAPSDEAGLPVDEGTAYPAKKKKRRSRGGAKRTARKHAAWLASEQQTTTQQPATVEPELAPLTDELPLEEAPIDSDPAQTAAEPATDEIIASPERIEAPAREDSASTTPAAVPTRRRGTGPTPKKSKVITKSGLLKRGTRGELYRSPAPEASEVANTEPTQAPIISPPIIPEALLERPAVALATIPEETPASVTPSAEPAALPKPQSKRGRPRAKASRAEASPPATEEVAPAENPAHTTSQRPAKPKATSPNKPKAAKKPAAKPATPRRGRPPGKKTPPADETPAT